MVTAPSTAGRAVTELLAHEREVNSLRVEQGDDRRSAASSIAVVSSPPSPAPTTSSRWARVRQLGKHALHLGGGLFDQSSSQSV